MLTIIPIITRIHTRTIPTVRAVCARLVTEFAYIRDPKEIYRRSFELVRAETDLGSIPPTLRDLVVRLVHACGMPDIVTDLRWALDAADCARAALATGAPVLVDCRMLAEGIMPGRLPHDNAVICTLSEPEVTQIQARARTTRSAAAVELWLPRLKGAVVAIGNAPTALYRLLELLRDGAPAPAAVFAFPVGFVGAAESKQALVESRLDIPYVTLRGRRGGSALAAAAINALGGEIT